MEQKINAYAIVVASVNNEASSTGDLLIAQWLFPYYTYDTEIT